MSNDTREALAADARAVLEELVAVQDLRKSLAQANHHAAQYPSDENYAVIDSLSTELSRRSKAAWESARAALTEQPAAPQTPVPKGYVKADQAYDALKLFEDLCDVVAEANAVDTVIGRPDVLRRKLSAIRDHIGHAANGHIPLRAAPQGVQAEPLTDEQIDRINCQMWASCPLDLPQGRMFARAIERAHGIAAPAAPAQEPQQPTSLGIWEGVAFEGWRKRLWELIDQYRTGADWPQSCRDQIKHHLTQLPARLASAKATAYTNASTTPAASSPAPAVQPTEAVAELVDALRDVMVMWDSPQPRKLDDALTWRQNDERARMKARALIAKHGQPQGGSNG
jgi:hypothetical protein